MNRKTFLASLIAGVIGAPLVAVEKPMARTIRQVSKAFNDNDVPKNNRYAYITPDVFRQLKRAGGIGKSNTLAGAKIIVGQPLAVA